MSDPIILVLPPYSVTSDEDWIPMMDLETIPKAEKAGLDVSGLMGLTGEGTEGVKAGPIEGEEWMPMQVKPEEE